MNYEFHLDEWLPRFPLQELSGRYYGNAITSPCDLCNVEWLRRGMSDQYDWGTPVPVDVFVMSRGEPEIRYATKIGGLPYRPRKLPWPRARTGRPLALLAQFNFANSVDIVGVLPADLLLIFGDDSQGLVQPLHMEWQQIGTTDLVQPDDMPSDCMTFSPCFGNRCRMLSYPDAVQKNEDVHPMCHGKEVWSEFWIPQLQATQIGRAPFFVQTDDGTLPGQPLCTIASVQPAVYTPYPWVNVPQPLCREGEWRISGDELMIGDLGCIYVFIEEDGTLHFGESCF